MANYFPQLEKNKQRSFYSISTVQSFCQLSNHIRSYAKHFLFKAIYK